MSHRSYNQYCGLAGISTNLLLETTLIELGKWGSRFVPSSPEDAFLLNAGSYALTLKTFFRPEKAHRISETYELHIDNEVLHVKIDEGELQVQQGKAPQAELLLYTDIASYLRLLTGQLKPDEAIAGGLIRIEGDPAALSRFLNITRVPGLTSS